jgi:OmpA-OmpF porin, OOP family
VGFYPDLTLVVLDVSQTSAAFLERRIMKKLNKVAVLFATAALAAPIAAFAQAKTIDNWVSSDGTVWKNGTNELCWRDANWTPATAKEGCDGALKPPEPPKPAPAPAPAPAPVAPPVAPAAAAPVAPPAAPAAPAAPPAPVQEKVTFAADAFFDTAKSVLKPEATAKLTDLVDKTKGVNLEVIIAVGHTDIQGNDKLNQKLSIARAEAVKGFLVGKGVEKNRVYTEGKGSKQPVADNKTVEGRAKNRRVEVEVVGTRTKK